jgi:hypothetical protein
MLVLMVWCTEHGRYAREWEQQAAQTGGRQGYVPCRAVRNTQPSAPSSSFHGAACVAGVCCWLCVLTVCVAVQATHGHGWRQQEQRGVAPWGTPSSKHTDLQATDASSCTFGVWLGKQTTF